MDGHLDVLELLDGPPSRIFTVYAGRHELCSWCGQKSYLTGGGVHHDDAGKSWAYAFCDHCKQTHGWPQQGQPITYKEGG